MERYLDFEEDEENIEDLYDKVDWKEVYIEYSKEYVRLYMDRLSYRYPNYQNDIGIEVISFDKLLSPKYYNYETDEIIVNVKCNIDIVMQYLKNNKDKFANYIAEQNRSYDGFISQMTEEFDDYINEITKEGIQPYQLSQILEFYMLDGDDNLDIDRALSTQCLDNISLLSFVK